MVDLGSAKPTRGTVAGNGDHPGVARISLVMWRAARRLTVEGRCH